MIEHELTPLQRRIFHLKHLRRQSIRAIATALGKSEDAIKANLYRMRRAIADGAPGIELAARALSGPPGPPRRGRQLRATNFAPTLHIQ